MHAWITSRMLVADLKREKLMMKDSKGRTRNYIIRTLIHDSAKFRATRPRANRKVSS
jgi:hypothetical protein